MARATRPFSCLLFRDLIGRNFSSDNLPIRFYTIQISNISDKFNPKWARLMRSYVLAHKRCTHKYAVILHRWGAFWPQINWQKFLFAVISCERKCILTLNVFCITNMYSMEWLRLMSTINSPMNATISKMLCTKFLW